MSKSAVGYLRLSQDSDTSIEDQRRDINEYISENEWELLKIFNEGRYESGFDTRREEYLKMKDILDIKDIDVVVVRDRARLGRDFDERMRFVLDLRQQDVELHTTEEGHVPLDDPHDVVMETMHSAADDKKKREEIKKAKKKVRQRIEKGYFHGRPPKGLQYSKDKTELVPGEEFEKVLNAIRMRESGSTYQEINEAHSISSSTMHRIMQRKEQYQEIEEEYSEEVEA